MTLDLDRIEKLTNISKNTLYHVSLQCDDFSNVKASSLKNKSLDEGSSTLDMVFDALTFANKFLPPTILIENVKGFKNSDAGKILVSRLKRLGYEIKHEIFDSRDFGGLTSRVRYYLIATLLPFDYNLPKVTFRNTNEIWDTYIEPYIVSGEAREVTFSKSLQDGLKTNRIRLIKRDSLYSPTFLKSQDRMAKDSVVIQDEKRENKLFFPSNEMMARLMSIPNEFTFKTCSKTIESEIIGQSIDYLLHNVLIKSIKDYLLFAHAKLNNRLF